MRAVGSQLAARSVVESRQGRKPYRLTPTSARLHVSRSWRPPEGGRAIVDGEVSSGGAAGGARARAARGRSRACQDALGPARPRAPKAKGEQHQQVTPSGRLGGGVDQAKAGGRPRLSATSTGTGMHRPESAGSRHACKERDTKGSVCDPWRGACSPERARGPGALLDAASRLRSRQPGRPATVRRANK